MRGLTFLPNNVYMISGVVHTAAEMQMIQETAEALRQHESAPTKAG